MSDVLKINNCQSCNVDRLSVNEGYQIFLHIVYRKVCDLFCIACKTTIVKHIQDVLLRVEFGKQQSFCRTYIM